MDWNSSIINKLNEINNRIISQGVERRKTDVNTIVIRLENNQGQKTYSFSASENAVITAVNINGSAEIATVKVNGVTVIETSGVKKSANTAINSLNNLTVSALNVYSIEITISGTELRLI